MNNDDDFVGFVLDDYLDLADILESDADRLRRAVRCINWRALRESRDRSLRTVAKEAGISAAYLSRIERGQRELSKEAFVRLADALDLPRLLRALLDELDQAGGSPPGRKQSAS
jgi:hypothetical protein